MKNNNIKFSALFLLCVTSISCYAQQKDFEMSNPIEFKESGWNKVLCMKNGNTLLFHFAPTKPLMIKVYDSTHKRIANQEYNCRILDLDVLKTSEFKGLFDINGDAVLFIEQEHLSKFGLVRLRFDGRNGQLIDEKLVKESPGISKRQSFYVMKNKEEDNYAILFSTDDPNFYTCDMHVSYFNGKHELVKEIPLNIDRKKYDSVGIVCAEIMPQGVCVALDMQKMVVNRTDSKENPQLAVYDHQVAFFYIPKDSTRVNERIVDMSTDVNPYYSEFTYNLFAKTINLLVFSYREIFYQFGVDVRRGTALGNMFFKIDEDNSDIKLNWVKNDSVSAAMKHKTDTSKIFYGMPLAMFTNENGLTTLVSESYERYDEPESGITNYYTSTSKPNSAARRTIARSQSYQQYGESENGARYDWNTYFGNIGITQLDDDGNEMWGTVLPNAEYLKSNLHYYRPKEIAKKNQSHKIFDDLPAQVAERQFVSLNSYSWNKNLYIIFNDGDGNYQSKESLQQDTIYNLENTNACYYKMTGKKIITKNYLLGEPVRNEYKCSFIEGADFDDQRGVYATLIQYKRNNETSLRMAWRHLD